MGIVLEVVAQLTNQNAGRRTQKKKAGKQTQRHKTERRKNMDSLHQTKTNIEKHQVFSTILLSNFQNGSGIFAIEF